ncbi:uncharacterized protein LOC132314128 [Cornus florida]|uniref:uncharacterized protein LOC132314128 n=1 Tax=Cornus florida TaxID=4283 RepID=UPI00289F209D|nr:uncharacterized protein LOC132314128 [Cornus florida]
MENQGMRQSHSPTSQLQHPLTSPTPFNGPKSQQQQQVDLDSFPPGYRFKPNDQELIELKYQAQGEKEWYFFTLRERKYANGTRPNRTAGNGFWKATAADKGVKFNGRKIGSCAETEPIGMDSPGGYDQPPHTTEVPQYSLCFDGVNGNNNIEEFSTSEGTFMYNLSETQLIGMNTSGYDQPPQTTKVPQYSLSFDGVNDNNNFEQVMRYDGTSMHNLSETELTGMNTGCCDQPPQIIEVPQYSLRFDGVNDQFLTSEGTSMHNLSETEPPRMDNGDYDQPPQTSTEVPHYLGFEELRQHQSYQQDMDSTFFGNTYRINPNASWSIDYHQLLQDAFT